MILKSWCIDTEAIRRVGEWPVFYRTRQVKLRDLRHMGRHKTHKFTLQQVFIHCVGTEEKLDQFSVGLNLLPDVKSNYCQHHL